jgi:RnfABCDGE-type electron transport complex G subunit
VSERDDFQEPNRPKTSEPVSQPGTPPPPEERKPAGEDGVERARIGLDTPLPLRKAPFLHAGLDFLLPALRFLRTAGGVLRRFFKKDSMPNLVLVMVLLTVTIAVALGITHGITKERIAEARAIAFDAAMGEVFPGYHLHFEPSSRGENIYEGIGPDNELVGFVVLVSPNGYAGPIDMIVGFNKVLEVTGVAVVSHRETRGFTDSKGHMEGGFLEQFAGGYGPFTVGHGNDHIDAIVGATVSCKAITQGVNEALADLERGMRQ